MSRQSVRKAHLRNWRDFRWQVIAWLISNVHPDTKRYYRGWLLLSFLVLEASVLLDLLTIYGTQIFWPFDTTPMAVPILFIIDPLFTLPIFSGALAALVLKRHASLGHRLNTFGLVLSLAYLVWAFSAAEFVERRVTEKLARQGVSYSQFISSPAPFNTLLWRVLGIDKDRYFETYFSLFDRKTPLFVDFYPRNLALMAGIEEHPPIVKLELTRYFLKTPLSKTWYKNPHRSQPFSIPTRYCEKSWIIKWGSNEMN